MLKLALLLENMIVILCSHQCFWGKFSLGYFRSFWLSQPLPPWKELAFWTAQWLKYLTVTPTQILNARIFKSNSTHWIKAPSFEQQQQQKAPQTIFLTSGAFLCCFLKIQNTKRKFSPPLYLRRQKYATHDCSYNRYSLFSLKGK